MAEHRTTDAVVIERSFDAPPELIWSMWTVPEHFRSWYGPDGATVPVAEFDLRVGGVRTVCLEMGSGDGAVRMWFTGEHRTVDENRRLAYTESMADPDGNVVSGAHGEGAPDTTEVRVQLTPDGDRTTMVLTHAGVPSDSPGATGWAMALDKLAARLADVT